MKTLLLKLEKNYILLIALVLTSIMANAQNQYDSSGSILWDATLNSGFNTNVTLIGRDDAVSYNQKQNTSGAPNPVTIGLGTIAVSNAANTNTFAGDKRFLAWGDNNADMSSADSDLSISFGGATGITTHTGIPNKQWKIVESGGDVGTTKVAINASDLSGLSLLSVNDAYVMIVADDAAFTTNVETIFLTASGTKLEANYDFNGTQYFTFGAAHELTASRSLTFNGVNNIMKVGNANDLTSNFSFMFWLKTNGQNSLSNFRTIVSKYNGTNGYQIYLTTDNRIMVSWSGGTTLAATTALPDGEWHNIAIVFNGNTHKLILYIDGVVSTSITSANPVINSNTFSMGAEYRSKTDTRNYFKGDIDEFKFWNSAISQAQIRFMMNQEIVKNSTKTKGTLMPGTISKNDISTLNWSNLVSYYTMNTFIGTHINDDSVNNNRGNIITLNKVTVGYQTAPMPYTTAADGLWSSAASWANGATQALPNGTSIVNGTTKIDWNIVKTNHNINSTGNKAVLGLNVAANTLSATNDSKIQVTHYLKLDGKIDLVGKSQLIQINNSDLDLASAGSLERDQDGQTNKFNFNYWSSPVSSINTSYINNGYTVDDVMRDGTNPNSIQEINWVPGADGSATSPISLSSYWIFKFQNVSDNYANWSAVGPYGALQAGQGYTLKGSAAASARQNYTFVGKPNNGTIVSPISANNMNLCGNPYASAIDSNDVIADNTTSTTGTLYFWEHFNTNSSHMTEDYQGGYATRTLVGGTPAVSVSGIGSSTKIPKRYIPVGQGFFVRGSATGGNIVFKNSQRIFMKEDNSHSNTMFKTNTNAVTSGEFNDNDDDDDVEDQFIKLHLGFDSADNHHRQILIGFMDGNATAGIDNGYDAIALEVKPNDMYFLNGTDKLNIQGEGYFNTVNNYSLGVVTATNGIVKFSIDETENFPQEQEVYVYDSVTELSHSIKDGAFEIDLPAGNYDNRFSLRFTATSLGTNPNQLQAGITVKHTQKDNMLVIQNKLQNTIVKSVALVNMIGQNIINLDTQNLSQAEIRLPITKLSSGAYIVKVSTDKGNVTKKILLN